MNLKMGSIHTNSYDEKFMLSLNVTYAIEHAFITLIQDRERTELSKWHKRAFQMLNKNHNIYLGDGYVCTFTPNNALMRVERTDSETGIFTSINFFILF